MSSLRSPLGKVLGAGSAKDGTEHFWSQRVSAAGIVLLGLWFVAASLGFDAFDRDGLIEWVAMPMNSILLLLLAVALAWHSNLGVQVVIEDYIHGPFLKVVSLILCKFVHLLAVAAALFAVLKIAFGGAA